MNKKVVADAMSQALKWQDIIVSEKRQRFYLCKIGWQHGYIRPIEYIRVFILN